MKIAHNRKWRSATSLVEGLHYFFALFLEEKQQFITTRRGEKKMPQNKRESLIYTFIMCFMMVFWMSIYNVSLHMGGLSMESIKAGWLGFPIAYIFAMCCDWFFVSKIAKGFAFKYLVKPDSSVLRKVISVSLFPQKSTNNQSRRIRKWGNFEYKVFGTTMLRISPVL